MENEIPSLKVRFAASILDGVIGVIIFVLLLFVFRISLTDLASSSDTFPLLSLLGLVLTIFAYETIALKFFGGTLGKQAFFLKVVSQSGNSKSLTWKQVIKRIFMDHLFAGNVVGAADEFHVLVNKDRQAWHDVVANTVVVQTSSLRTSQKVLLWFTYFVGIPILLVIALLFALDEVLPKGIY